jgi:hypothetical protein
MRRELTSPRSLLSYAAGDVALFAVEDIDYLRYHQHGTEHMPARRPIIPLPEIRAISRRRLEEHVKYEEGLRPRIGTGPL